MSATRDPVLIVGGGVIGAACAHHLSQAGHEVTILDRGAFGKGCSHANCGLIVPSHVLPLAEPGAVKEALKALFKRNSPFSIKPRWDPALWSWLWNFARRCNRADMLEAGRGCHALLCSSLNLYHELMTRESLDCEWEPRGVLHVYRTAAAWEGFSETDRLLREVFDVPARRLTADDLLGFEPALKPGLAGGWYYEHDAQLRPDKLLRSWRQLLEDRGVTVSENCEVRGFAAENGRARGVVTDQGTVEAETVVVALGAWTPFLSRELGCRIPIQPGKGYSMTMPRPKTCPGIPLMLPEHKVVVTPLQSGYRLGSTMEFAGYDETLPPRRLQMLKDAAANYLREPYCDPVEEEWFGWRPMTYDGNPIIDCSPTLRNVLIAAGHNMLGLSMAPATGKLVRELIDGEEPHIDPSPYRVRRFGQPWER